MDKDGGIDGGMRMPEWELKETSPLKTKWRKYIPAETEPTPSAVNNFLLDWVTLSRSWNWNPWRC